MKVGGGVSGRRVLVIEDDLDTGLALLDVLELEGHRACLARDGRSGVAMARALAPEIVLCDIGLPGEFDGYAVARTLSRDASLNAMRLVALTGFDRPEDLRRASDAGFHALLGKPPAFEALGALMRGEVRELRRL